MTAPGFDITQILRDKLAEQPLYKKYSNTLTTVGGLTVGVIWLLVSSGIDVPDSVTQGGLVLTSLLTVIGVRLTPNGVTEKQIAEIEAYVGRHRAE
ncbi:MAG: hypothetical protein DI630_16915 [Gordonia sp. (in: high G+C Gram-positive bacteria)]|nr:MAG: hypothetical protein DI630_16915 [Gordonia sp. (in: high G+C Gram-positive bacteria)]